MDPFVSPEASVSSVQLPDEDLDDLELGGSISWVPWWQKVGSFFTPPVFLGIGNSGCIIFIYYIYKYIHLHITYTYIYIYIKMNRYKQHVVT